MKNLQKALKYISAEMRMSASAELPEEIFEIIDRIQREYKECCYYGDDLGGACEDASSELLIELRERHYDVRLVEGRFIVDEHLAKEDVEQRHYWLELDDKILDITATQFNDEVEEGIPLIVYGTYEEFPRYKVGLYNPEELEFESTEVYPERGEGNYNLFEST